MKDVLGQERVVNWLQSAYKQGRLAHAYLFTGPNGSHKKQMAIELAKTVNCEQRKQEACNECPTCLKIMHGNHPDVITISPDGAYIKIDQIRSAQAIFRYRAQKEITRVLIIECAERMRIETANSLLKFLEEPVSRVVAILLTEKKERILPTIRSRCGWVRFSSLPEDMLLANYQQAGFEPAIAFLLANLSTASERLEQSNADIHQIVDQIIRWTDNILTGNVDALLTVQVGWLAQEIEQGRIKSVVELLLLWLREATLGTSKVFLNWEAARKQASNQTLKKLLLATDNALIATRLLQKAELSPQAILEQMVIATQEGWLSKKNDWRLIML